MRIISDDVVAHIFSLVIKNDRNYENSNLLIRNLEIDDTISEDEYRRPLKDLDSFFKNIYDYYFHKGACGYFIRSMYTIIIHVFVISTTSLIIFNMNWKKFSTYNTTINIIEILRVPTHFEKVLYVLYWLMCIIYIVNVIVCIICIVGVIMYII